MQRQVPLRVEQQGLRDAMIGSCAISLNQKRLWAFYEREPDSPLYNFPVGLRIVGPLDPGLLRRALNAIMARHEILRTTFAGRDGIPLQITVQDRVVEMPLIDISGLTETVREAELRRLANEEIRRPFNLSSDGMLRALLLRVGKADHVLVLTTNLIAVDVWSMGILLRELTDAYAAYSVGKVPVLPELPMQYADFSMWQNQWLQGEVLESRLSFWKQQLAGIGSIHHAPVDLPRPPMQTHPGAREVVVIPKSLAGSLKVLSQRERVSLFMTLLAGFQGLLHHYSGHDNIVVGTCVANRNRLETEGVMGLFANDLILRTDLSGNPTFRELLGRVRLTALMAYTYQDLPIGKLAEELHPGHDLSRQPLFQAMFILQDDLTESLQIPGLTLSRYKLHPGTAEFDLMVLIESGEELEVTLEYNTDLFEAATIRQMLDHYETILERMVRDPEGRIGRIRISTQPMPSKRQLLCSTQQELVAPKDALESQLVRIWESGFGRRPISVKDDFFELGGDSLLGAQLFAQIEKTLKLRIPLAALFEAPTVEKLAEIIRQRGPSHMWSPVVAIQSSGSRPAFFCAHGLGGNVFIYRDLVRHLGPDQPFYGLQCQGLDGRQPFLTRIEDMAALYVKEIQEVQPRGPYLLGGYCTGGTVALEMAQQLRAQGQEVTLLALFDTSNWAKITANSVLDELYFHLEKATFHWQNFCRLNSKDKLRFLRSKVEELKARSRVWYGLLLGKFTKSHQDRANQLLVLAQLWEINKRAVLDYVPSVYPGRISQFRPMRQYTKYQGPELGWDELAAEGVEIFELPVYPAGMLHEPFVRHLAAKLKECIEEASTAHLAVSDKLS